MCVGSASMEECLPPEMLEAILGKLDRETLCTARLVSRTFCAAASPHISSLTFRSPYQAVSLEHFPRLEQVTVNHTGNDNGLAQLDPHLRAVITRLAIMVRLDEDNNSRMLRELLQMPKLRELTINGLDSRWDGAKVLQRLTSLEVFGICACTPSAATTIMTLTRLTSLDIGLEYRQNRPADVFWLQHATNLWKLQALRIEVSHEALPLIGNLTGLTGLTLVSSLGKKTIAPLSRLTRLRSLDILPRISDNNLAIACSMGSGSLARLSLSMRRDTSADCGRLLAHQTTLTSLALTDAQLCSVRQMGAMRLELLQNLELVRLNTADAGVFDALQRATNLTSLTVSTFILLPDTGLNQAVARLTQLRSLRLSVPYGWFDIKFLDVCLALSPLTALTQLSLFTELDNGGVRALLGFTGLQMLALNGPGLTADVVPDLTVLTNLRTLTVTGVESLWPATSILNPLCRARGWPPVDARCG